MAAVSACASRASVAASGRLPQRHEHSSAGAPGPGDRLIWRGGAADDDVTLCGVVDDVFVTFCGVFKDVVWLGDTADDDVYVTFCDGVADDGLVVVDVFKEFGDAV